MSVGVCGLLLGLFLFTPDLGYSRRDGNIHCFCGIVARTQPHFAFLLHVVSGLLLLALFAQGSNDTTTTTTTNNNNIQNITTTTTTAGQWMTATTTTTTTTTSTITEKQTETTTLILSIVIFVCLTGLLSFDILTYPCIHSIFVVILFTTALVFSLHSLHWQTNGWHCAGTIAYAVTLGMLLLYSLPYNYCCFLVFFCEPDTALNITKQLQLLCAAALVFMFSVYVYSDDYSH